MRTLTILGSVVVSGLLSACGSGGIGDALPASAPAKYDVDLMVGSVQFSKASVKLVNSAPEPTLPLDTVLPATSAGTVSATPVTQVIHLNKTSDGKYFGGSDATGTYLMDPASVEKYCASSAQVGYSFLLGHSSRACAAPDLSTDTVVLPQTCSRDSVLYTIHMKDGGIRWFDWTSARKFLIASDSFLSGVVQSDGGHVLWNNYAGATLKVAKTSAGKASVTVDFGSNCVGAFGQMNDAAGTTGHLVDMSVTDGVTWLMFLFHSDKSGADGGSGWGSEPWVETASGYTVQPSIIASYLNFNTDTGNYFVTIPDVPCNNAGNITAYRGTKQADGSYLYDPGTSGSDDPLKRPFGLGWLPIQADPHETQLYSLLQDPSVVASLDRTKFQMVIGSCD